MRVTTHWLRYTTLTWVKRSFARAYAGHIHSSTNGNAEVTATYVKATLLEVTTALSTLTGEPPAERRLRSDTAGSSEPPAHRLRFRVL
jgi:hypothetical protein